MYQTIVIFLLNFLMITSVFAAAPQVREGYLLVRHKVGITSSSANSVHIRAQAKVIRRFDFPAGLELVKINTGASSTASLTIYQKDPNILYAEPNYIVHAAKISNDTFFGQQWGLNNLGQLGGTNDADVNAVEAWDVTTGKSDVVIGTIDTGIDYNHPDLLNNVWVNQNEIAGNHKDDDGNGYVDDIHGINVVDGTGDPMDDNGHGTHVAGIIAAEGNNALGVSGVMPNGTVAACKFLDADGGGDTADAIECLNYYRALSKRELNPVNIVATNNSWAGGAYSQALYDAIKGSQEAGVLFITAASNETSDNDVIETYPANFRLSNVISVAATDHNDKLAFFSNYGKFSVHVAAPGFKILSTIPNGKYDILSGTSMAAPFVSGLAGLIKSFNPSADWIQIKNLIIAGGQFSNGAYGKTISGRRIRAIDVTGEGSLSCKGQTVMSRLLPKSATVSIKLGQSIRVSMLSINCDSSTRKISSTQGIKAAGITLKDDGVGLDDVANDGVFNGSYTPSSKGNFKVQFSSSDSMMLQVK